jgi:diguanylate cyclase (GGDEF)-like protein
VVLLVAGWLIIALPQLGSVQFLINTAILTTLGLYAFGAAAKARATAVGLEKKLRLDLLVHNVELENSAMRDDLTQLFNRRYFFTRIERELQAAKGFNRPISVAIVDLHSMKAINEEHGHRAGDRALEAFGSFLLQQTRASDVPARIGSGEFAIILPDTDQEKAAVAVNRLEAALEKADIFYDADTDLKVYATIGVSGFPWAADTVDTLISQAQATMYANKTYHHSNGASPAVDASTSDIPAPDATGVVTPR